LKLLNCNIIPVFKSLNCDRSGDGRNFTVSMTMILTWKTRKQSFFTARNSIHCNIKSPCRFLSSYV